jgi:hypothetical protein
MGFGLAVAVRMILIARFDRILQAKVHNHGTEDVRQGLDAIRDQRKGVPQDSARDLSDRKYGI